MPSKVRLRSMRRITQHTAKTIFKWGVWEVRSSRQVEDSLPLERLAGAMVRVFEVRGAGFPDAPSDPGNRRGDQIQHRTEHENFEGAIPFPQSGEKQA